MGDDGLQPRIPALDPGLLRTKVQNIAARKRIATCATGVSRLAQQNVLTGEKGARYGQLKNFGHCALVCLISLFCDR
jgi:hypothetical protein